MTAWYIYTYIKYICKYIYIEREIKKADVEDDAWDIVYNRKSSLLHLPRHGGQRRWFTNPDLTAEWTRCVWVNHVPGQGAPLNRHNPDTGRQKWVFSLIFLFLFWLGLLNRNENGGGCFKTGTRQPDAAGSPLRWSGLCQHHRSDAWTV